MNPIPQFLIKQQSQAQEPKHDKPPEEAVHESPGKVRNQSKQQNANPYLYFHHSPEGSHKSPFSPAKHPLNKGSCGRDERVKQKQVPLERRRRAKDSIIFTARQEEDTPRGTGKMGMLLVGKISYRRCEQLGYSLADRTMQYVPMCKKCNKMFHNYSGLGGHLRVCQAAEAMPASRE